MKKLRWLGRQVSALALVGAGFGNLYLWISKTVAHLSDSWPTSLLNPFLYEAILWDVLTTPLFWGFLTLMTVGMGGLSASPEDD